MSTPFIGELRTFGFNFAPRGWAMCNGQLLAIAQNQALFSLLGTTYGGNGTTNFALPNLQGRMALHFGTGLSNYVQGQVAGTASVTMLAANMPSHTHTAQATATQPASTGGGGADTPVGNVPANSAPQLNFAGIGAATGSLASPSVSATAQPAGGNQPFANMPPYLALNICIALQGIFPSRN